MKPPTTLRAVVRTSNASKKMQEVQVQQGKGSVDEAEHFEAFGITGKPHPGAEAILIAVDGAPDHPVVIAVSDRRHRPKNLAAGETCVYDSHGHQVRLLEERIIVVSDDIRLGSNNASGQVARVGDSVSISRGDNLDLFALLDAIAGIASLPPIDEITGVISTGSDVTRTD